MHLLLKINPNLAWKKRKNIYHGVEEEDTEVTEGIGIGAPQTNSSPYI